MPVCDNGAKKRVEKRVIMIIELNPGDNFKLKQTIIIQATEHYKFDDVELHDLIDACLKEVVVRFLKDKDFRL